MTNSYIHPYRHRSTTLTHVWKYRSTYEDPSDENRWMALEGILFWHYVAKTFLFLLISYVGGLLPPLIVANAVLSTCFTARGSGEGGDQAFFVSVLTRPVWSDNQEKFCFYSSVRSDCVRWRNSSAPCPVGTRLTPRRGFLAKAGNAKWTGRPCSGFPWNSSFASPHNIIQRQKEQKISYPFKLWILI